MSLTTEARQFLRSTQSGLLCTHSVSHAGYPYGSVAPFVPDHDGQPILLISTLAEHTKNIMHDCRVSLLVFAGAADLQANARLTLLAEAEPVAKQDGPLRDRYLRYMPQARQYFEMHDFRFYRLQVRAARYIAGFGRIGWVDGTEFRSPPTRLAEQEAAIIEHMNRDHRSSMQHLCRHFHGVTPQQVEMIGIDGDGFDLHADGRILRFGFERHVTDADSARTALIEMARTSDS
ncbi:MAG TPA: DUF2470 domain-containing protein [Methylophilaceae bacterium]|jgi:putative heme iron utilization protein